MTYVSLHKVHLQIPVFESGSMRLLRLPSFSKAKVGTRTTSASSGVMVMHALNGLDLRLDEGDRVCIIGHNGAGKTSLLRLIAGIYPPSGGLVEVSGKVVAMLGSGITLNPDATGYENIQLVADLWDWPKSKMAESVQEIEEFTELGEYLQLPTRVYSTGMSARLAFAIATMQSPDILLIDEGIGAGDAQFQQKAEVRITEFLNRAKIVVLASHSDELCRALCNKALVLSAGRKVFFGGLDEAFVRYAELR